MISGEVKLNGRSSSTMPNGDFKINLNNGDLVVHYTNSGCALGVYLVTSFRDNTNKYREPTTGYCSFVDLKSGYLKFEERCSRNTTLKRVLSHLNKGDYYGEQAIKEGQYVEVYSRSNFDIDVIYDVANNKGWR